MGRSKHVGGEALVQEVQQDVIALLEKLGVGATKASYPANRKDVTHWYMRHHTWQSNGVVVNRSIALLNESAQSFFETVELTCERLSRSKGGYDLIPKRVVEGVISECVARRDWHQEMKDDVNIDVLVSESLRSTLFAEPRFCIVKLPVYGLWIDGEVDFLGVKYLLAENDAQYCKVTSESEPDDQVYIRRGQQNTKALGGVHIIASVEGKARFLDDAILRAERVLSRDLAIIYYTATRECHGVDHLRVPSLIDWHTSRPSLHVVASSDQDGILVRDSAFSFSPASPVNMNAWAGSKWYEALRKISPVPDGKSRSATSDFLDALSWLGRSAAAEQSAERLLYQITALECLLPISTKEEKVHQVTLLTSVLGSLAGVDQSDVYRQIRRAYTVRSEVVHGSRTSTSAYEPDRVGNLLDKIVDYLLFTQDGCEQLRLSQNDWHMQLMERLFSSRH